MAWSKTFQKCIFYHFLDIFSFANIFTIKLGFATKKSTFANLEFILQILKAEHNSFPMMYHLSFLHMRILVFKYPSRERVKKQTKHWPQTLNLKFLYLCNVIFDISNFNN